MPLGDENLDPLDFQNSRGPSNASLFDRTRIKPDVTRRVMRVVERQRDIDDYEKVTAAETAHKLSESEFLRNETNNKLASARGAMQRGIDWWEDSGEQDIERSELKRRSQDILGGLDGRQREAFESVKTKRLQGFLGALQKHEDKELLKSAEATSNAYLAATIDQGAENFSDWNPENPHNPVDLAFNDMVQKTREDAQNFGYSEDRAKQIMRENKTKFHLAVIEAYSKNKDASGANRYYKAHKSDIRGVERGDIEENLATSSRELEANITTQQWILKGESPLTVTNKINAVKDPQMQEALRKSYNGKIDATTKAQKAQIKSNKDIVYGGIERGAKSKLELTEEETRAYDQLPGPDREAARKAMDDRGDEGPDDVTANAGYDKAYRLYGNALGNKQKTEAFLSEHFASGEWRSTLRSADQKEMIRLQSDLRKKGVAEVSVLVNREGISRGYVDNFRLNGADAAPIRGKILKEVNQQVLDEGLGKNAVDLKRYGQIWQEKINDNADAVYKNAREASEKRLDRGATKTQQIQTAASLKFPESDEKVERLALTEHLRTRVNNFIKQRRLGEASFDDVQHIIQLTEEDVVEKDTFGPDIFDDDIPAWKVPEDEKQDHHVETEDGRRYPLSVIDLAVADPDKWAQIKDWLKSNRKMETYKNKAEAITALGMR